MIYLAIGLIALFTILSFPLFKLFKKHQRKRYNFLRMKKLAGAPLTEKEREVVTWKPTKVKRKKERTLFKEKIQQWKEKINPLMPLRGEVAKLQEELDDLKGSIRNYKSKVWNLESMVLDLKKENIEKKVEKAELKKAKEIKRAPSDVETALEKRLSKMPTGWESEFI